MEYTRCLLLPSILLVYFTKFISGSSSLIDVKGNQHDSVYGMWCPIWRNMLCGSDGITYWNDCLYTAATQVKKGLSIIAPGSCDEIECDECIEETDKYENLEICGSNGQVFNNSCYFECYVDVYPQLTEVYEHCRREFPTKAEEDSATSEIYKEIFDSYAVEYRKVVKEYNFDVININKFSFQAEILGQPLTILCRKITIGNFSNIPGFDQTYFYAYNDVYGRTKLLFQIPELEIRVRRFKAVGLAKRVKGRLKLKIDKNTFELIVETSSSSAEGHCPIMHATSLRLVDADEVTVVLKPALPSKAADFPFDGLIKEKLIQLVNDVATPIIVQKLAEIPCLKPLVQHPRRCFGFFQKRMCF